MTAEKQEKPSEPEKPQKDLTQKIRSLMEQIKNQAKLQEKAHPRPHTFKHEK